MKFNIIKELYFNKSNKDILNSIVQYMSRHTRTMIIRSFNNETCTIASDICNECFHQFPCKTLYCSSFKSKDIFLFCAYCSWDHNKKHTKNCRLEKYQHSEIWVQFDHKCEFAEGYLIGDTTLKDISDLINHGEKELSMRNLRFSDVPMF